MLNVVNYSPYLPQSERTNKLPESIQKLEQAINIAPDNSHYWNTLGARKYLLACNSYIPTEEKYQLLLAAEKDCLKASSISDYSKPHQNLASIYIAINKLESAKKHIKLARDIWENQGNKKNINGQTCIGCPVSGSKPDECKKCDKTITEIEENIKIVSGDYRIE